MKTPFALFVILSLSLYSCIGRVYVGKPGEFKNSKEKYSFVQEYESPENIHLTLSTVGGNVEVSGYEGNRVKVAFVVTNNNGDVLEMTLDELQKYASFVITKEGSNLSIEVKEIFKRNMSVGFVVKAPVKTVCSISTSGGNLDINNLVGDQTLETSGGNINMTKIKGQLSAQTSGGNIYLEDLTGKTEVSTSGGNIDGKSIDGDLFAETSGGNIGLVDHKGITEVSTSGGNIHLENLVGAVSAQTSGGNIHAKMIALSQKMFLETNGGFIDCELPEGLGMNLELSGSDIKANLNHFQGTTSPEHISGQINGGGIPVQLNCPGGTLQLKFNKVTDNQ